MNEWRNLRSKIDQTRNISNSSSKESIHISRALLSLILVKKIQQSVHWNSESGGQGWGRGSNQVELKSNDVNGGWGRSGILNLRGTWLSQCLEGCQSGWVLSGESGACQKKKECRKRHWSSRAVILTFAAHWKILRSLKNTEAWVSSLHRDWFLGGDLV